MNKSKDRLACDLLRILGDYKILKSENKRLQAIIDKMDDGWISVDDRLPDENTEVLSYMPSFGFDLDCIHKDRWDYDESTHWMIPSPPKE